MKDHLQALVRAALEPVLSGTGVPAPANITVDATKDAKFGDFASAISLRDEAVKRRRHRREALRTIDAQVSRRLVQLVFDGVSGNDLDVSIDELRRFRPRRHAVPRMCLEELFVHWSMIKCAQ